MIEVVSVHDENKDKEIFYLEKSSIFSDSYGIWYGKFYKKNKDGDFIEYGIRALERYKEKSPSNIWK